MPVGYVSGLFPESWNTSIANHLKVANVLSIKTLHDQGWSQRRIARSRIASAHLGTPPVTRPDVPACRQAVLNTLASPALATVRPSVARRPRVRRPSIAHPASHPDAAIGPESALPCGRSPLSSQHPRGVACRPHALLGTLSLQTNLLVQVRQNLQ